MFAMLLKYYIVVTNFFSIAYCANILAIVPCPLYSHQVAFFDLWEQLSLRGHKVTLITTDPRKNEKLTNLTEIDVSWTYNLFPNASADIESTSPWTFYSVLQYAAYVIAEEQLSHPHIQDILRDKGRHFDVVFVEFYYFEFLGFGVIHNCPMILISSMDVFANIHNAMGNPTHPLLYGNIGAPFQSPLGFVGRSINTVYYWYKLFYNNYISFPMRQKYLSRFFNITCTFNELLNQVDMIFLNVNPVILPVRPIGPTTINIGGLRKLSSKPLPKDLAQFLDSASNGFIYFSLGSNIKSKNIQSRSLKNIVETLKELPYKILWKYEAEPGSLPSEPSNNVKLIKWAPQQSVLAHRNIKAFVTQGGLQSMEESVYFEVPCIVIPFHFDQHNNAKLMKNKGFALIVERYPFIKKEELKGAIIEVINNTRYKKSVKMIKRLSLDTPMTGLEKAIWWTEYVIRNNGTKHLRNPAADLPFYKYYLLDVVCFFSFVIGLALFLIVLLKRILICFKNGFADTCDMFNKKVQ